MSKEIERPATPEPNPKTAKPLGFSLAGFGEPFRFMAGLLGASSDAPVYFEAGHANPDNSASSPDSRVSSDSSILKGAIQHG